MGSCNSRDATVIRNQRSPPSISPVRSYENMHQNLLKYAVWIQIKDGLCGSGILLTNKLVLTCAHILIDNKLAPVNFSAIKVYPGFDGIPEITVDYGVKCFRFPAEYLTFKKDQNQSNQHLRYDYALIELEKQVVFEVNNIKLLTNYLQTQMRKHKKIEIKMIGFPKEQEERKIGMKQSQGFIQQIKQGLLFHQACTLPGMSGSSILLKPLALNKDLILIVGIHLGSFTNGNSHGKYSIIIEQNLIRRLISFEKQMMGQRSNSLAQIIYVYRQEHQELEILRQEN